MSLFPIFLTNWLSFFEFLSMEELVSTSILNKRIYKRARSTYELFIIDGFA